MWLTSASHALLRVKTSTSFLCIDPINFPQFRRQRMALGFYLRVVVIPLQGMFLRLQLLQPQLQRRQCSLQTIPDELGIGPRLPRLLRTTIVGSYDLMRSRSAASMA